MGAFSSIGCWSIETPGISEPVQNLLRSVLSRHPLREMLMYRDVHCAFCAAGAA